MTTLDHQVDHLVDAWRRIRAADRALAELQLEATEQMARDVEPDDRRDGCAANERGAA